ncbi:MAG: ABC transporter permease [Steroidobacteraceae bacterium]
MTALTGTLHHLLNICRKELLVILKDPANRLVLVLPVVLQSLLFGYAATFDVRHVPYALLDESRDAAAVDLVAKVEGSGLFGRVATLRSVAEIAPVIDREEALLVLHIGQRFESRLRAGEAVPVQAILDARNSSTAGNAATYLGGIVARFNDDWRARHGAGGPRLTVVSRAWFNPNLETRWHMLPALMAGLSMLQTLLLTALSVAREREQGTFDQMLVTPYRPWEIMVGKSLPSILVGLVQATLIFLVSTLWFGVPFSGSLPTLYAGLTLFTVASVGIGLSISALSASMQQAMLYSFVLLMPFMLLSGLATPVENMPEPMQWLTTLNPLRYAIHFVQRVWLEGVGLGPVAGDLLALVAMAAVTLPLAAWLFRHRLV